MWWSGTRRCGRCSRGRTGVPGSMWCLRVRPGPGCWWSRSRPGGCGRPWRVRRHRDSMWWWTCRCGRICCVRTPANSSSWSSRSSWSSWSSRSSRSWRSWSWGSWGVRCWCWWCTISPRMGGRWGRWRVIWLRRMRHGVRAGCRGGSRWRCSTPITRCGSRGCWVRKRIRTV